MKRILMTGSRDWSDVQTSIDALNAGHALIGHGDAVLCHGAARGADDLLRRVAEGLGIPTEAHPAQWNQHDANCPPSHQGQQTCRMAGHRRNGQMVGLGADVCLAFPTHGIQLAPGENPQNTSRGTWDCATKAKDAGIPTLIVWGALFFPFGDAGARLLQQDAERKGLTLGASMSMPIMEAWLPF